MYEKALVGALGVAGTSYAAYKTLFPWMAYDAKDIAVTERFAKLFEDVYKQDLYIIDAFEKVVREHPDRYFLIFEDRLYTYEQIDKKANKFARVARSLGIKKGDVVAMIMNNEANFVSTLLGLQKIGVTASMINTSLTHKSLSHCINVCKATAVVTSGDPVLYNAVSEVISDLDDLPVYVHSSSPGHLPSCCTSIEDLLAQASPQSTETSWRRPTEPTDIVLYVYTSGTTGLPKPAVLSQLKGMGLTKILPAQIGLSHKDVMYTCLPLFHSSGLYLGVFNIIGAGATIVISRNFSASRFWAECRRHKVTGIQYIGELCRYLLTKPPDSRDGQHSIRFAYGNGLRKDIWDEFQTRFNIPQIYEFFGSTEGPASFVNLHNRTGAIGRYSPYMAWKDAAVKILVKYDIATAEPIRDKNGRCIKVKQGETGLLLAAFPEFIKPDVIYVGDKKLTEKKLARNVLQDGDVFFNFGDLLYMDKDYFLYFADRIGDTFRWKGENVSTLEVANTLSSLDFLLDANVYGVTVPGQDGRAGMACLVLKDGSTDLDKQRRKLLFKHCVDNLPKYARPLFLRIQAGMVLTTTHKQRKVECAKEGFDVNTIPDPMYYLEPKADTFVPLDKDLYLHIITGNSKL